MSFSGLCEMSCFSALQSMNATRSVDNGFRQLTALRLADARLHQNTGIFKDSFSSRQDTRVAVRRNVLSRVD